MLTDHRPDAVLVLGDTNSCIAALMAKRMRIPTYHMEAGNRCFDDRVPEETNRRMIDHFADYNMVYTEHARRNLLAEGIHPSKILLTGSPMREVLRHNARKIASSDILGKQERLRTDEYFLVSLHREENVDDPLASSPRFREFNPWQSKYGYPALVSTHPRTQKRLARTRCHQGPVDHFIRHLVSPIMSDCSNPRRSFFPTAGQSARNPQSWVFRRSHYETASKDRRRSIPVVLSHAEWTLQQLSTRPG